MPSGIFNLLNDSQDVVTPDWSSSTVANDNDHFKNGEDDAMDEVEVGVEVEDMEIDYEPGIKVKKPKTAGRGRGRPRGSFKKSLPSSLRPSPSGPSSPAPSTSTATNQLEVIEKHDGGGSAEEGTTRENSPHRYLDAHPLPSGSTNDVKDLSFLPDLTAAVNKRLTNVPAFDNYMPSSIFQKRGGEGDEEGGSRKARKGKAKARVEENKYEVEEDQGDDRLHCICQLVYDADRIMIACDRCENWFHPDCLKFTGSIDLVDQFICPTCESETTERTSWKMRCDRPTCLNPVAPLTKYCSDYCGIEVAATRIELSGIDPERLWSRISGARRREGVLLDAQLHTSAVGTSKGEKAKERGGDREREDENEKARPSTEADDADENTLIALRHKLESFIAHHLALNRALELINYRLKYLKITIRRWEALCSLTAQELGDETGKKSKSSSKRSESTTAAKNATAQCGFDARLVYESDEWEAWLASEEGQAAVVVGLDGEEGMEIIEGICLSTKKKCERHGGWQKVREADFEVEKAVLVRRIDPLSALEQSQQKSIDNHLQSIEFRNLHRGRKAEGIDVEDAMQSRFAKAIEHRRIKQLEVKVKSESMDRNTPSSTGGEGDDYIIPDEVLKFMSLSERNQYRSRLKK